MLVRGERVYIEGEIEIPSFRLRSRLLIRNWWGWRTPILNNWHKDECLWVAGLLKEALSLG